MSNLGKQLEALKAAEFLKREKPQDSAEAIEFMDFKARHPELLARFRTPRERDDREPGRQLAFVGEVVERREKFAFRQIACRAENDERARLRQASRN